MRSFGAKLSSEVIYAHMSNKAFTFENNSKYKVGMYSAKFNLLYGEDIENINFQKEIYLKGDILYVVDQSAHLHLGIKYIVLKDASIFKDIETLKQKVIYNTILALILISIIGFFLGRLFLKPIADERERLDKFIKDTTHELNTPISALLMSISSLKDENLKAKERIKLSATRISNIYNDLCYLLKDELNLNDAVKQIDLKDILEEQIVLLETYSKSKKIEIKASIDSFMYSIDLESSKRLINNIITNALKYSKPNSSVEITLKDKKLIVKDYGIGIDEKSLKLIKNRYYRANNSEGGFGIGLDIVNSICKKYDITFKIESKKDIGSTVSLEFK